MTKFQLSKADILRGKTRVDLLFQEGSSFIVYPYRVVYRISQPKTGEPPLSALITVSKRYFKKAVKRNVIRRRIKEAYRLQKAPLSDVLTQNGLRLEVAILFLDKKEPEYAFLEKRMIDLIARLSKVLTGDPTEEPTKGSHTTPLQSVSSCVE